MRDLNHTASATAVTDPLTWDNTMELVRGNNCVVDNGDNPCTWYLINDTCVLAGRELKTAAMTNGVSGRGGGKGPIQLVSGSAICTKGQFKVYNHQGRGGATHTYKPRPILWE